MTMLINTMTSTSTTNPISAAFDKMNQQLKDLQRAYDAAMAHLDESRRQNEVLTEKLIAAKQHHADYKAGAEMVVAAMRIESWRWLRIKGMCCNGMSLCQAVEEVEGLEP